MELEDLRRQWRQSEAAPPPPLTGRDLDALLKGRALGLVARMRRNAWLETGFTVLLCLGAAVFLTRLHDKLIGLYSGLLLAVGTISLLVYRRLLLVLRRMDEPAGSVRGHLAALAQGMRQLLQFYYRLTIWTGPVVLLLLTAYYLWRSTGPLGALRWNYLVGTVVGGTLAQGGIVYLTRWYLQRLYGCHLDRLEGQLRELEEGSPAAG